MFYVYIDVQTRPSGYPKKHHIAVSNMLQFKTFLMYLSVS